MVIIEGWPDNRCASSPGPGTISAAFSAAPWRSLHLMHHGLVGPEVKKADTLLACK